MFTLTRWYTGKTIDLDKKLLHGPINSVGFVGVGGVNKNGGKYRLALSADGKSFTICSVAARLPNDIIWIWSSASSIQRQER